MKFYINLFWVSFKIYFFFLAGFHFMDMFAVILDVSEVGTQDSSTQKWLIQTWMIIMTKK